MRARGFTISLMLEGFLQTASGDRTMKKMHLCVAALCAAAALPTLAAGTFELVKQKQCLFCHKVDGELVGPSFKDIATSFGAVKDARAVLQKAVVQGTDTTPYHWGAAKMPPGYVRTAVNQAEAAEIVDWILQQK
jgi:cytochrome c551/c552